MTKKIILLGGKISSGKNEAYNQLVEIYKEEGKTVERLYFAQGVKETSEKVFKRLSDYLNKLAQETSDFKLSTELTIKPEAWYEEKTPITRILLQTLGDDIFRREVSDSWWVDQVKEKIKNSKADVIILTDFRYPNEYFLDHGEVSTILLERNADRSDNIIHSHESENSLSEWDWDFEVKNDGSKEDLKERLRECIEKF